MIQHLNELVDVLKKYNISPNDFVISSSSAMAARDICYNHDIDLVLFEKDRKRIIDQFRLKPLGTGTFDLSEHVQVCVEKYSRYGISDVQLLNDDKLMKFDDYRIIPLELELCRIIDEDREKDAIRIRMIEQYINEGGEFDFEKFRSYMDFLNQSRNFKERLKFWLKYNNPKRSGIISFALALSLKIKGHVRKNTFMPSKSLFPRLTLTIPPGDLLLTQGGNDIYDRLDILVNYYSIMQYDENDDETFYLSKKKDIKRTGIWQPERYTSLIKNIKKEGYSLQYPILIDSHGRLIDGGHRLAAALYFGVDIVSVRIISKEKKISFGEDWFLRNGFSKEEINSVKNIAGIDCALKNGICTVALAFGYSAEYWNDIRADIEKHGKIIEYGILDLRDELKSFLDEIYSIDAMDNWKIIFKYNLLKKYEHSVMYVIFKSPDGRIREREDGMAINNYVVRLKADIRNKYAVRIGDYCRYSDTVVHMGDNPYSNKKIIQAIRKREKFKR